MSSTQTICGFDRSTSRSPSPTSTVELGWCVPLPPQRRIPYSCSVSPFTDQHLCAALCLTTHVLVSAPNPGSSSVPAVIHSQYIKWLQALDSCVQKDHTYTTFMRWVGHVARMGERRGVYRVLVGKPDGKTPLGSPRRRWEDNIKMDLQEVGCLGMGWIDLA